MQWSKLRSHMLTFVAPGLRKRIDFHLIVYRKLSECANEFFITVDGQKTFSASTSRHNIATYVVTRTTGLIGYGDSSDARRVDDILSKSEVHAPTDITSSIRTYFDLDPHVALASSDPVLKALAIIDRRIGRRTLKSMELTDTEHSLVKTFYILRMEGLD
jgi:hypothetical protein